MHFAEALESADTATIILCARQAGHLEQTSCLCGWWRRQVIILTKMEIASPRPPSTTLWRLRPKPTKPGVFRVVALEFSMGRCELLIWKLLQGTLSGRYRGTPDHKLMQRVASLLTLWGPLIISCPIWFAARIVEVLSL